MKKGRLGVSCSVALVILLFSLWAGSLLPRTVARDRHRHQQQTLTKSRGPGRAHLKIVWSKLSDVQTFPVFSAINANDKKPGENLLLNNIGAIEEIERKPGLAEIKPAFDFYIGRAYV
jgi:hypothetical protein